MYEFIEFIINLILVLFKIEFEINFYLLYITFI